MLQAALNLVAKWVEPPGRPCICLEAPPPKTGGIVVEIALGASLRADEQGVQEQVADARLLVGASPTRLREVVQFCARHKLPVDAWLISGLWQMPARTGQIARWLHSLSADAGSAVVWVERGRMPAHFERRLIGHLRRLGCELR